MKIRFETKPTKGSFTSIYTIFMEHKGDETVELLITRLNVKQLELHNRDRIAKKEDEPITDGILAMSRPDLKKFVAALNLLVKN